MTAQDIPVTVPDLLARVTQATGNIAKHRAAMASIATKAMPPQQQPSGKGGEQQ
jgi:hypothetical protein